MAARQVRMAVDSPGASSPLAGVAYYEASDLPGLLEAKRKGEVVSIVPVQMLRVQFRPGSDEEAVVQAVAGEHTSSIRNNFV